MMSDDSMAGAGTMVNVGGPFREERGVGADMGQSKTRPRKAKTTTTEPTSVQPSAPTPADRAPQTHTFAYSQKSPYAACTCGVEQDMALQDGKAVRLYRAPGLAWSPTVAICPKYVAPVEQPIPEDSYAAPDIRVAAAVAVQEQAGARGEGSLVAALRKANPGMFEPEIIGGTDVDEAAKMVDLTVACSPVLRACRGGIFPRSWEESAALVPLEAMPLDGDRYRVFYEEGPRDEPVEVVKVMRARYLLQRAEIAKALYHMDSRDRERWARLYKITWLPPKDSPLHKQMMTGEPISIKREGDAPVDMLAVLRALSTPGAEVPAVCPTIEQGAKSDV